jgi:hypothetical protein
MLDEEGLFALIRNHGHRPLSRQSRVDGTIVCAAMMWINFKRKSAAPDVPERRKSSPYAHSRLRMI